MPGGERTELSYGCQITNALCVPLCKVRVFLIIHNWMVEWSRKNFNWVVDNCEFLLIFPSFLHKKPHSADTAAFEGLKKMLT